MKKEKFNIAFGKYLAIARKNVELSQGELADALGYSSPQYVSNWERGLCLPPKDRIGLLIEICKIDPPEMFNILLNREVISWAEVFSIDIKLSVDLKKIKSSVPLLVSAPSKKNKLRIKNTNSIEHHY